MSDKRKLPAKILLSRAMEELLHQKPFNKISVNDLCDHSHISRSAFYANFQDKYQLFAFCMSEKKKAMNQVMPSYDLKSFLVNMLEFIRNEDVFFYNAFGAAHNEEVSEILCNFLQDGFTSAIKHRINSETALTTDTDHRINSEISLFTTTDHKTNSGNVSTASIDTVSVFYTGGLIHTIMHWIKSSYATPKEELADCLYSLLADIAI